MSSTGRGRGADKEKGKGKSKGKGTTEIIIKNINTRAREEIMDESVKKKLLRGSRLEERIFLGLLDDYGDERVREAMQTAETLIDLRKILKEGGHEEESGAERSGGAVADL